MPELPEVETTRLGITPHLVHRQITQVIIRQAQLRWPINKQLGKILQGQNITGVSRRAKYLLIHTTAGTLIIHLGMSGSLRVLTAQTPAQKHDHFDLVLETGRCLRLRDPRRFGAVLWTNAEPASHKLLKALGPEPLSQDFSAQYLYTRSRKRKMAVKQFIMDSHSVAGMGNIYANEALFLAGIRPTLAAGRLSKARYEKLVTAIQHVLQQAIASGGTTLRDFTSSEGKPGYFQQQLRVYNRAGLPCVNCQNVLRADKQGQRATYYCPVCQR